MVFESTIGAREHPFLNDHRYFGRIVVPAAYHLALALAAAQAVRAGRCAIEDALFGDVLLQRDFSRLASNYAEFAAAHGTEGLPGNYSVVVAPE